MRALYYLMENLDTADAVVATLQEMHLGNEDYFVVSRDQKALRRHRLRGEASHNNTGGGAEQAALVGGLAGLSFAVWIALVKPAGVELGLLAFLTVAVFMGAIGAWIGAMIGLSHDDPRFLPFQNAIAAGYHLMVVNVSDVARLQQVKRAIRHLHPDAVFEGEESAEGQVQYERNSPSSSHRL